MYAYSVVAAALTPSQIMCKPIHFVCSSVGWFHVCRVKKSGIAIISRHWRSYRPSSFVVAYNVEGINDIKLLYSAGSEQVIKKIRISYDEQNTYLDYYYAIDESNVMKCVVLDCDSIDVSYSGLSADNCTLMGEEISV